MDNVLQTLLTPNDNIPVAKDMPIIDDDAFDYQGYQVVRGEFFAHTYEPSFTFNQFKVSVNTAFYGVRDQGRKLSWQKDENDLS